MIINRFGTIADFIVNMLNLTVAVPEGGHSLRNYCCVSHVASFYMYKYPFWHKAKLYLMCIRTHGRNGTKYKWNQCRHLWEKSAWGQPHDNIGYMYIPNVGTESKRIYHASGIHSMGTWYQIGTDSIQPCGMWGGQTKSWKVAIITKNKFYIRHIPMNMVAKHSTKREELHPVFIEELCIHRLMDWQTDELANGWTD